MRPPPKHYGSPKTGLSDPSQPINPAYTEWLADVRWQLFVAASQGAGLAGASFVASKATNAMSYADVATALWADQFAEEK
jgi:hypothetical protein